ncbi:MAG TPA: glycerophosphodiester phosphodiesterase family protein [Elusimicrobiales bacterium]|nr:glycerophosphodiester phosphodiesterase family protein [Elusimicrobiales bacterium]
MKIISHRGASGYAPENTLKAFRLAVEMGSKDFEFDVHRTRDGILVVHHDYSLKTTAGKDVKIAALDYAELKKYNVAAHFKQDKAAQHVPRLEEVIDIIGPAAAWLNFEVKNDHNVYPGIEEQLLAFLRSRPGLFAKAVVSSFDGATLRRFRAFSPEVKLAYLGHGLSAMLLLPALKKARALGAVNFHMALRLAFKLNVSRIKKAGFRVCVYTVNTKKDALRMKAIGVDGIFSNYPDLLGKWELKG